MDIVARREKYLGPYATGYEARRSIKAPWNEEQAAITELVKAGPVLDIPIGTGRYLPIYREKGIDRIAGMDISPDMLQEAKSKNVAFTPMLGSIFDIPYGDNIFKTVVCTRLLNWLTPKELPKALSELLRVGERVILSIRLGDKPWRGENLTHTFPEFVKALGNAWIVNQIHLKDEGDQGDYWMMEVKRPTMKDVEDQFLWNRGGREALPRLHLEWCDRYQVPHDDILKRSVEVRWLTGKVIGETLNKMAEIVPRLVDDSHIHLAPRRDGLPITWVDYGKGLGQLDGRHRVNQWRDSDTLYPVFYVA